VKLTMNLSWWSWLLKKMRRGSLPAGENWRTGKGADSPAPGPSSKRQRTYEGLLQHTSLKAHEKPSSLIPQCATSSVFRSPLLLIISPSFQIRLSATALESLGHTTTPSRNLRKQPLLAPTQPLFYDPYRFSCNS